MVSEIRLMVGNGNRTHDHVYDNQIMLYYFFYRFVIFFIPWSWWWWFSNFEEWQKVPMKPDIVYMDTISLAEYHCTGVWEVYSCTIYQRLALCRLVWRRSVFLRGPGKRELWKSCIGGGRGEKQVCVSFPFSWS